MKMDQIFRKSAWALAFMIAGVMLLCTVVCMAAADLAYAGSRKPNSLKVSGKTVKVKQQDLGKKSVAIARKKVLTVKKAKGKVTYKIIKVTPAKYRKYFRINKKTGKVTVKKGLKKGTYKIKAAVTAAGNKKKTRKATFKVVVREEQSSDYPILLDIHCAQTAMDKVYTRDLYTFVDVIRYRLQPQAVNLVLQQFPDLNETADMGMIGKDLPLYIYYERGDKDGVPSHEKAEPSRMQVIGGAGEQDGEVCFQYMLAVDVSIFCQEHNPNEVAHIWIDEDFFSWSTEMLKNRLAGEMLRALMFDYNRTGMLGTTDINNAVRVDSGRFPNEEAPEEYSKLVFPKWFTEGAVASVENVFKYERDQFRLLRSAENNDLLKNYLTRDNGFDLEDNVLTFVSESSCRTSGYLAVLYLAELAARKECGSSIDENGAVSAEKLRTGLDFILKNINDVYTLDEVIYEISPDADGSDGKLYNNTEEFEKKFIKGEKDGNGQYAGDKESIDFVNTLLDYLESGDVDQEEQCYGGSILTDLKDSRSPLDAHRGEPPHYLHIVDANVPLRSTFMGNSACVGGGRS